MEEESRGRVATAECPDCHYRFPKPEMHEHTEYVQSGRAKGVSFGLPRERGGKKTTNPRFNIRQYERKKTVWVCGDCHEVRVEKQKAQRAKMRKILFWVIGILFVWYLIF